MPKKRRRSLPPQYPGAPSSATLEKPIRFRGVLRDFKEGQLCFVVARRYLGKGPVKLILHAAKLGGGGNRQASFGYGAFGHWVVSPGSLVGEPRSAAQIRAARINGAKSKGRPRGKSFDELHRMSFREGGELSKLAARINV